MALVVRGRGRRREWGRPRRTGPGRVRIGHGRCWETPSPTKAPRGGDEGGPGELSHPRRAGHPPSLLRAGHASSRPVRLDAVPSCERALAWERRTEPASHVLGFRVAAARQAGPNNWRQTGCGAPHPAVHIERLHVGGGLRTITIPVEGPRQPRRQARAGTGLRRPRSHAAQDPARSRRPRRSSRAPSRRTCRRGAGRRARGPRACRAPPRA